MNKASYSIDGMHCGSCVSRVSTVLRNIDGVNVEHVAVGSAEVSLDPAKVSAPAVAAALAKAGYPAQPAIATEACQSPTSGKKGCGCCGGA